MLNYSMPFLFMSRWFLACILEVPAAHTDFSPCRPSDGQEVICYNFLKEFWDLM